MTETGGNADSIYGGRTVPVDEGAEAFVELLNANDVKHVFFNPGSDTIAIIEAIAKFRRMGRPSPEVILCQHESLAMTVAHGYFMVTGKPQVVLVHVDMGTQQVGGALHNAFRGMAGIILCAGVAPWTLDGGKRGSRTSGVHYTQETLDQAGIVRGYVKWNYEIRCNEHIHHVLQRAFQIAGTEPCGPVYLILPPEVLMERIKAVHPLPKARYGAALGPGVDASTLRQVARLLIDAENPLVVVTYLGRHRHAVEPFVKLAETLAMRVGGRNTRMNFPTDHPLWVGANADQYIRDADVILVVDTTVPYSPPAVQPLPDAKIIHIDLDPIKASLPLWNFPADFRIQADSSNVIPDLYETVLELITAKDKARLQERFQHLQKEQEARQAKLQSEVKSKAKQRPISPEWFAYCLAQEVDEDTIVFDEALTVTPVIGRYLRRTKPGTVFQGAGSLGMGLGASLGIKLASPESTVVCVNGDGGFLYGHPIGALWAANRYKAPFLDIVIDNEGYRAMDMMLNITYGPESYFAKAGERLGMSLSPSPDYALLAQASGAWGETVEDPDSLQLAIRKALQRVRDGQPVVLAVKMGKA
jgi:acetolactate synthase-1/2/3 large subunit